MPEGFFHPFYRQWDDGTIGKTDIGKGEKAATTRLEKWSRESFEWDKAGIDPARDAQIDIARQQYVERLKAFENDLERNMPSDAELEARSKSLGIPVEKLKAMLDSMNDQRLQANVPQGEDLRAKGLTGFEECQGDISE